MTLTKHLAGFPVHPIGIGTWTMGGDIYPDKTPFALYGQEDLYIQAIQYALGKGANHIDTAQMYGAGHTEEIVGRAIAGTDRSKLFLASKIWKSHCKRASVPHAIEGMLARLRTSYLDLVYVHAPWDYEPMEEYILGLCDAVDRGLTRAIGVSNFPLGKLKEAVAISRHPIAANQMHYNFVYRDEVPQSLLSYCRTHGIMIVAYSPLARGGFIQDKRIRTLAEKYGKTPAQIALAWLIAQDNVVTIPKSVHPERIDENFGALSVPLTPGDRR